MAIGVTEDKMSTRFQSSPNLDEDLGELKLVRRSTYSTTSGHYGSVTNKWARAPSRPRPEEIRQLSVTDIIMIWRIGDDGIESPRTDT
jgi:hypothetical protein